MLLAHFLLQKHHDCERSLIDEQQFRNQVCQPLHCFNVFARKACDGARGAIYAADNSTRLARRVFRQLADVAAKVLQMVSCWCLFGFNALHATSQLVVQHDASSCGAAGSEHGNRRSRFGSCYRVPQALLLRFESLEICRQSSGNVIIEQHCFRYACLPCSQIHLRQEVTPKQHAQMFSHSPAR